MPAPSSCFACLKASCPCKPHPAALHAHWRNAPPSPIPLLCTLDGVMPLLAPSCCFACLKARTPSWEHVSTLSLFGF